MRSRGGRRSAGGAARGGAASSLLIGVGNRWRGDDGAGPAVSRLLRRRQGGAAAPLRISEADGGGLGLIEAWAGASTVFLIDAVCSGEDPGTIHRFEPGAQPLPAALFRHSTHAFGVVEAVELARVLARLPPRLIVYGIEGRQFAPGAAMSPEVELATRILASQLWHELIGFIKE
ncbi:MAG: hydrogenase maturation protease [Chloroflexales bacterium]|nr:hydrogenase maturation protease [Chloroflexales bacterium]